VFLTVGAALAQDAGEDQTAVGRFVGNTSSPLVPCVDGVIAPCDFIAKEPEDIAGVWMQFLQGPFFNAPGEVAYIRFFADGTFNIADSIEHSAQPFQNYPTGRFQFFGEQWSTPLVLNDGVRAPCTLATDNYQVRVMMYGDQPVAMQFVLVSDGCAGRGLDYARPLIWVSD
jgi:hypothetical protein